MCEPKKGRKSAYWTFDPFGSVNTNVLFLKLALELVPGGLLAILNVKLVGTLNVQVAIVLTVSFCRKQVG
jgi:hypothetical protein